MVGGLRDLITCAEFQIEIFMGYDFTGGRIFDFCIDFSMGLTTVQRYCAACDSTTALYCDTPKCVLLRKIGLSNKVHKALKCCKQSPAITVINNLRQSH